MKSHIQPSDLRGISRMTIDAVKGVTDLVEAMHGNIAGNAIDEGVSTQVRTRGITGFVYGSIRGITSMVGAGLDAVLGQLVPLFGNKESSPEREVVQAALNGVLGDYLETTENPLTIPMQVRRDGKPLALDRTALANALPQASGKLLVLVHGLCMSDLQWQRQQHDHGASLEADLGYTSVYLHYNSGRHISINGREFAEVLERLVDNWPVPVEQLVIIGHSMGGLVTRSACHYATQASHTWPQHLRKLMFLGTPHHGAPMERGGNWIDLTLGANPFTAPLSRLGKIRSAGITDLRHTYLLDEDWQGRDRFEKSDRSRHRALPLPDGVQCYAIAASTGNKTGDLKDRLLGDGLVLLNSALGRHREARRRLNFPEAHQWIGYGMNHLDLLNRHEVYERIREWMSTNS